MILDIETVKCGNRQTNTTRIDNPDNTPNINTDKDWRLNHSQAVEVQVQLPSRGRG